jgi:hypothetical protein
VQHPDARFVVPVNAVDDLLRALPPGHGVLARSRLLSSYRELCLVGRIGESLAVRPPRD